MFHGNIQKKKNQFDKRNASSQRIGTEKHREKKI